MEIENTTAGVATDTGRTNVFKMPSMDKFNPVRRASPVMNLPNV